MKIDPKRVAVITVLMLLPVAAFAAAAASGADASSCSELFASWFSCGGGCPNSP